MKFALEALFLVQAAFAQGPRVQILLANRYSEDIHGEQNALLSTLATLRSPRAFEIVEIDPRRPILDGPESILAEVRRRVLAGSVDEALNVHVVIDSHGSPTAIHSRECAPVPFAEFAVAWRTLMAEFVDRGYRPAHLTFDLLFHFCFAGNLKDQLGPLPFDTLVINSAQRDRLAMGAVIRNLYSRLLPVYVAATGLGIDLGRDLREQELFYLLTNHIYRIDLSTGKDEDGTPLPAPEIEWWPTFAHEKDINIPVLADRLFDLFVRAIQNREVHKPFINTLRYTVNEYEHQSLSRAVRARASTLSPHDRVVHDHLFFHSRFENGMSVGEITKHFETLRVFPNRDVRDAAIWDLLMLFDMVPDAETLLAKQAEFELAQADRDPAHLRRYAEYLEGYRSPLAIATCQQLLRIAETTDLAEIR